MKAVIMAGGEGKRLKRISGDCPKPMMPLLGRPVMEHILELLKANGITRVCVTLRYKPEWIMNYFRDGSDLGIHIEYRVESQPLGTAGGVKACMDFVGQEDFLVISGDAVCDFDLRHLIYEHQRRRPDITLALYRNSTPLQYGLVLTDPRGRVVSFIEKPPWERVVTDLVNTGIYVVSPRAMDIVPQGQFFDFAKDLFPRLMDSGGELLGVPMSGYWCDIGTPRAYYQCNLDALDGKIRLQDAPLEDPEPQIFEKPARKSLGPAAQVRELRCRDRASLMRMMSEYLAEFGADFTDGLCLNTERGRVRISPASNKSAIIIEAEAGDRKASARLLAEYENLVRECQKNE